MTTANLIPGDPCPDLEVALIDGGRFNIRSLPADERTLIVFYRGLHCPKCKTQLRTFDESLKDFADLDINLVAISMDDRKKANDAKRDWKIDELPIGYGLDGDTARMWDLYMSRSEFDNEPAEFCEPGLFLVEPDGSLYAAWIQSTPFARPRCEDLLEALEFVRKKEYPARGKAA